MRVQYRKFLLGAEEGKSVFACGAVVGRVGYEMSGRASRGNAFTETTKDKL